MAARPRARARAQGQGHRRRFSQARASRSSVYETIQEERPSPGAQSKNSKTSSPTIQLPVLIADPSRSSIGSINSIHGSSLWEDEQGVMALRRYYALRDEAQDTVTESRKVWLDTPFSVFSVQCELPSFSFQSRLLIPSNSIRTSPSPGGHAGPA